MSCALRPVAPWPLVSLVMVLLAALAMPAEAQVIVDRQVSSVYGQVITLSDVWQALELRLVPTDAATFDAARRELEMRLLVLREAGRGEPVAPSAEAIAAERRAWQTRRGGADLAPLLERAGLTEAGLDAWFKDSATIAAYMARRFGGVRNEDRAAAITQWIRLLRDRAGLPH